MLSGGETSAAAQEASLAAAMRPRLTGTDVVFASQGHGGGWTVAGYRASAGPGADARDSLGVSPKRAR